MVLWQDCGCLEMMEKIQKLAFVTWLGWKEIHPPLHIDSDRNHIEMFIKLAEAIEFAEGNWMLIFSHSSSCWLSFPYYLPGEKQPRTPISHSFKGKVFLYDKIWYVAFWKLLDMAEPQKSIFDFNVSRSDMWYKTSPSDLNRLLYFPSPYTRTVLITWQIAKYHQ